jgi:phospholipid transport system substrate-binding protein
MFRRPLATLLAVALGGAVHCAAADKPPATAQDLCGALIAAMKAGPSISFSAREQMLAPVIRRDFDLGLMSRIVVGPPWRELGPDDRKAVTEAFSEYSIASYAQRFRSFSGERFEVDPKATGMPDGDSIVHTKLFTGDPEPVQLDYLMRQSGGKWRIIDVFLSGTISELAARRSEYSLVMRTGGAPALVDLLRKKTVELSH